MKIYYLLLSFLFVFYSCNKPNINREICYDDIFEFTGMVTHRYELVIYSIDKLNSCFIKNNPDVIINSNVYVDGDENAKKKKFMESVSLVNAYGNVEERVSKIQWDLESYSDSNMSEMKWQYYYNKKDLIKEIQYEKEFDSSNFEIKSWKSVFKCETKRDSLGRIISSMKYRNWHRNSWELQGNSLFYYSNSTEIEEYDDFHLEEKWKYIKEKDNKGNLIKEVTYIFKKDKWVLYSQRELVYTDKKEQESYKYWSWFYEKLEDKYSRSYIYNNENKISMIITVWEHLYSNGESDISRDTVKLDYYPNGLLKKIDEGRAVFLFEYYKNGLIKNFIWLSVFDNRIADALMIEQTYTKK